MTMIGIVEGSANPATRRRLRIAVVVVSLAAAATGSILLATTGGSAARTTTRGLTETLHLPGAPDFAVAIHDALWVSTHGVSAKANAWATGQLRRIDLASGAVVETVPLSGANAGLVLDGDRVIADPAIAGTSGTARPARWGN
jgi:hypothetical protein